MFIQKEPQQQQHHPPRPKISYCCIFIMELPERTAKEMFGSERCRRNKKSQEKA